LSARGPAATLRLALEPLAPSHASEAAPFLADPAMWRYIPRPLPTAEDVARRFAIVSVVDRPNGDRWLNWVLRRHADGQAIGLVETTVSRGRRAYLAYFVFVPFQRQGYAREACASTLAYLRDGCGVVQVDAEVDTRNAASQRLLEALGFTRDATLHPADPIGGEPAWDYRYGLVLA
jgi:ribosomal-protein-alanine N-acetyltransferase